MRGNRPYLLRMRLLILLPLLLLAACSPFDALNLTTPSGGYTKTEAVAYGDGKRLALDIYRPDGAVAPLKTVVFFYGGSWKWGDRGDYAFAGEALASKGFLVVVPDYRLYPEVRFPGFVEDGAKAVAWTKSHIADHGGDPDQVYLAGHSAGGHIALLLTLDERFLAAEGVDAHSLKGTVAMAAPAAFDPLKYASVRPVFEQLPDPNQARPIQFVDGTEAPLLLQHGLDDDTVFLSNTEELAKRVREKGGAVEVKLYPDTGHIGLVVDLSAAFRPDGGGAVLNDIAAFIRAH